MGTLVDISGNGNNGTISGAVSTENGMLFKGFSDIQIGIPSAVDVWSVAFRALINDTGVTQYLFGRSGGSTVGNVQVSLSHKIAFRENTGAYTIHDFDPEIQFGQINDFVIASNGSQIILYTNGVYSDIVTPVDCGIEFDAIGAIKDTVEIDCEFFDYKQFNYMMSAEEAIAYHNSFQQISQRHSFDDLGVGSII